MEELIKAETVGVSKREIRTLLFRGREQDAPQIRSLLRTTIKSLPAVSVGDRWYLEEFAPRKKPELPTPAEEPVEEVEEKEIAVPRTERYQHISFIRMKTPYGIVSMEEIDANVTLDFNY